MRKHCYHCTKKGHGPIDVSMNDSECWNCGGTVFYHFDTEYKPDWTEHFDFLCSRCDEFVTPTQGFICPKCNYVLIARQERKKLR